MDRLILIFGLLLCSCSTLMRIGGAAAGGGVGSLGGPLMAGVGAGAGVAAVDAIISENALSETREELQTAEDTIKAISTGDVQALVDIELGKLRTENKGAMDSLFDSILSLLKLGGLIGVIVFIGNLVWTWKRKKVGEKSYARQDLLESELKDLKDKIS